MTTSVHQHVLGATPGASEGERVTARVSPALPADVVKRLEEALYYGVPEEPEMPLVRSWSLLPLDREHLALSRAVRRRAATGGRPTPLLAHSVVFDPRSDLLASAQILEIATDESLFPTDPTHPTSGSLVRSLPPAHGCLEEAFGGLLKLTHSERTALAGLIAATLLAGDEDSTLRGVVLALPNSAFAEDIELLRTFAGLAAALPRRVRTGMSWSTYQDALAPRPVAIVGIPEGHRCIARLRRSPGYFVFPGPRATESDFPARTWRYASNAAQLLLQGRFEELQALAATYDTAAGISSAPDVSDVMRHADLLRLGRDPSAERALAWLAANPLPDTPEQKAVLFDAIIRALAVEAQAGNHDAGTELLRSLGARWTDRSWVSALLEPLRVPLTNFVVSWHEAQGWGPVMRLFGQLSGAAPWLRDSLVNAAASALAQTRESTDEEGSALLATLDAQLDAHPSAIAPVGFLRWRAQHLGDDDGRVRAQVRRRIERSRNFDGLVELFGGFDDPRDSLFELLLRDAVVALLDVGAGLAVSFLADLSVHFGKNRDGLVVLKDGVDALATAGAERETVETVVRLVLPLANLDAYWERVRTQVITAAARSVGESRWAALSEALTEDPDCPKETLAGLRRLWLAAAAAPGRVGTPVLVRELRRIHTAAPELALEPTPHAELLRLGGPGPSATLAVSDVLQINRTGHDDDVRRLLGGLCALVERVTHGDTWEWERAVVAEASAGPVAVGDRATALWWLWAVGRETGRRSLASGAVSSLIHCNLLAELPESRLEVMCRLLPSESRLTRDRLVAQTVEGAILRWTASTSTAVSASLFRNFSPQADRISDTAYRRAVRRLGEAALLYRDATEADVRLFVDRVYVPRHWEALGRVLEELAERSPELVPLLQGLRRTTLGRRLPPSFLGGAGRFSRLAGGRSNDNLEPVAELSPGREGEP